jgi:hypothetical protein
MYANLSQGENDLLQHISMFGSAAYPIRKSGSRWFVDRFWNAGGFPSPFKTKREATERFEQYMSLLRDRAAGRI